MIAPALAVLVLASVVCAQTEPPPKKPWTILCYGAADNNADGPILEFMGDVRRAIDDDPGIELLFFIDRSERYSTDTRSLGEDFTGVRLYRLHRDKAERLAGGIHFPEITLDRDVELDSADASNLAKFIAWGKTTSPADRYALLIYSHANGQTMCPDEESKRDMGIAELTDELGPEASVDFLALELCNMGGLEIAYQWRPEPGRFGADVLVAIPNAGPPLDWHLAFERIRSPGHLSPAQRMPYDPAEMTAADFGRLVIEEGRNGRIAAAARGRDTRHEAAACYDLKAAKDAKESVDALACALAASDSKAAFLALREPGSAGCALNYTENGPYVDAHDLCRLAAGADSLSPEARAAARSAGESIDRFVIASFGMGAYEGFEPGANGAFIVLPAQGANWKNFRWYTPLPGAGRDYGHWVFLADGATPGNAKVENWFELLDTWFDEARDGGANMYLP